MKDPVLNPAPRYFNASDHPVLQDPAVKAILTQPYGRFSDAEYARRRKALTEVAARNECDAIVLCGEQRVGTPVVWLTGWKVTTEAMVVFSPNARDAMFVEHYNHVPNARIIACEADVAWAQRKGAETAIEELKRRGAKRVGIMGLLSWGKQRQLAAAFDLVDLNRDYSRLRMHKSDEEILWMRIGAAFSDLGITALAEGARIGMTERELGSMVEREYHALGGATGIHFIGVTSMAAPDCCVPRQYHSSRRIAPGDMLFVEFTATFWDWSGQVLRTFTVDAEPTPLFRELHDVAQATFDAVSGLLRHGVTARELLEAASVIEAAGFTANDDIMHGTGGGYLAPVLGARSRPAGPVPDMILEKNMTVVLQPNVITRDEKAGVQLGEMLRITETGFERMHNVPEGLVRIG